MNVLSQSKLGSILFSTVCLVAFGLLADPVMKPAFRNSGGIEVRTSAAAEKLPGELWVVAGKSIIVESSSKIVRVSIDNPALARATAIDEGELLVNAKMPGRTTLTVWREDGTFKNFDLRIDREMAPPVIEASAATHQEHAHYLASAYQDAMARVQHAITGVDR
jgi:Flp pilus assembly secretin CpaC